MPEEAHNHLEAPVHRRRSLLAPLEPASWRQQVLQIGLTITVVLGAVVYVPSVVTAVSQGLWGVVVIDSAALLAIAILLLLPRVPFLVRSTLFLLVLFALGAFLLFQVGPISQVYLMGFSLFATLLLGLRVGLASAVLNALTLFTMGVLGYADPSMRIMGRDMDTFAWTAITLNFLLVNVLLAVAIGAVVRALEDLIGRADEARHALERERGELVQTNAALQAEMFERARAEEMHQEVEARLAATLESMTDAFYMLDAEWRFAYINREAERIMQRPREDLLGGQANEIYPDIAQSEVGNQFRRAMRDGTPSYFEYFDEMFELWFEVRLFPTENNSLAVYFRDITTRKRADEALRASENRFRTVFNQQFQFMVILSPEGRVLEVNDLPLEAGGLSREQVIGKLIWESGWWEGLPDMQASLRERLEKALRVGKPILSEDTYRDAEGEIRVANTAFTVVRDEHGAVECFILQGTDITEQRRAVEAARQSEALLGIAGEMARLGGWAVEIPSYRMSWTVEVCAIHEVPPGQVPSFEEGIQFYAPEWRETIAQAFEACATEGIPYDLELELITAKGRRVWVRTIGRAERDAGGTITRVQGAFQDISDRKQAEAERRQLAGRLVTTLESITDAFFTLDREWRFTFLNSEAERLLQRTRDELIGAFIWEVFPEAIGTISQNEYERAMRDHVSVEFEHDYAPLGKYFDVRGYPTEDGLAVYFRDITERKQAQEQLRAATDLLERTFESLDVAVMIVEKFGRSIVRCNLATEKVFGYTAEEMLGKPTDFLHVDQAHHDDFGQRSHAVLERDNVFQCDFQMRRKDGTIIDTQHTVSALRHEQGELYAVVSVIRDITAEKRAEADRRALEEQLLHSQKLEAVGRLAGGVAHDFNNMLSVILGHAELMDTVAELPEDCREDLREIMTAGRRSADLTRQLLAFARKQTIVPEVLNLNDTISRMLKMLERLLGENIELTWKPGDDAEAVKMDPAQIDQILVNLVVNARDAVSTGGRIVIETRAVDLDEEYCQAHIGCEPGPYVLLMVSDNGCGMNKETIANLFEPFFTTKPLGKGTGLGLPTVYGIVQQNGGIIHVYSEVGRGSTFNIYLPRHETAADSAPVAAPVLEPALESGTVLLVEDEEPLLALGKRMLERMGFTVLAANRPSEALRLATECDDDLELLITDVVMPEMTGLEVYERLQGTRPGLKCLFMSGYTADIIGHHGVLEDGQHFIQKPFTRDALRVKIHELMSGA